MSSEKSREFMDIPVEGLSFQEVPWLSVDVESSSCLEVSLLMNLWNIAVFLIVLFHKVSATGLGLVALILNKVCLL